MGQVTFRLEGDEAGAVRAFLSLTKAQQQAELGAMKYGRASKQANEDTATFGDKAFKSVSNLATGYLSVAAAAGVALKAITDLNAKREETATGAKEGAYRRGALLQLGGGDPAQFRRMIAEVRKSRTEAGLTGQEAEELQFLLESMGEADQREFMAGFKFIADPKRLAEGASTLKRAFGEKETGGSREIVNKMLAASAMSKTTLEQFAPAATISAQMVSEIKGTDEELLGTLSILSRAVKDADVASTQMAALGKVIMVHNLGGQGLLKGVAAIGKEIEGMDEAERVEYFGRIEGFKGYLAILKNLPDIERAIADVQTAGAETGVGDLSDRMKAARQADPRLAALRSQAMAEEKRKIGETELYATDELLIQAIRDSAENERRNKGKGEITRNFLKLRDSIQKYVGTGKPSQWFFTPQQWLYKLKDDLSDEDYRKYQEIINAQSPNYEGPEPLFGSGGYSAMFATAGMIPFQQNSTRPESESVFNLPSAKERGRQAINQFYGDIYYLGGNPDPLAVGAGAPAVGID